MMSEEELREKALKALRLLLFERTTPGMKGWELKRKLGKDYLAALEVAKVEAEKLGLRVVSVPDEEEPIPERARYLLLPKEPLKDPELGRWLRIEEAASLAVLNVELSIRGGVMTVKAAERLLTEKLPKWRVKQILDKLRKLGYIEMEGELLRKGWRMKIEIDEQGLLRDVVTRAKKETT